MDIEWARREWRAEGVYLNTASFGLPPTVAFERMEEALDEWRHGRTSWEGWTESVDASRRIFARLVNADPGDVATGATVSELFGLVAAALPDGTRIVAPENEFTSMLFPLAAHADRGVDIKAVAARDLAESIGPQTDVVVFSAVQSSTGEVADLAAVGSAAKKHGALLVVDATQAVGWRPFDASGCDVVVCHAYKWLMSPRGSAFMVLNKQMQERVRPLHAGWFAGEDIHSSYYGRPLRLARSARRFDTSPAWFSWVGTEPALALVEQLGVEAIHAHDVGLANRFLQGLGHAAGDSAIVKVEHPGAAEKLERAGIKAATRAGSLRASFHVYNTSADVDAALDALHG